MADREQHPAHHDGGLQHVGPDHGFEPAFQGVNSGDQTHHEDAGVDVQARDRGQRDAGRSMTMLMRPPILSRTARPAPSRRTRRSNRWSM